MDLNASNIGRNCWAVQQTYDAYNVIKNIAAFWESHSVVACDAFTYFVSLRAPYSSSRLRFAKRHDCATRRTGKTN